MPTTSRDLVRPVGDRSHRATFEVRPCCPKSIRLLRKTIPQIARPVNLPSTPRTLGARTASRFGIAAALARPARTAAVGERWSGRLAEPLEDLAVHNGAMNGTGKAAWL
jgi:hypothetical protein